MTDDLLQRWRERGRDKADTDIAPRDVPNPGQLEIHRRIDVHGVVLALRGELDLASSPQLEQALREIQATKPRRVLIDLRHLDFMDCTGISLMVWAQQSAHARGHQFALRRGPDRVRRLFELTGLLDHFVFLNQ